MPMGEFRYKPEKISGSQAETIGEGLEDALRHAISQVRPDAGDYGVTIEGDPFGSIAHKQPDLRIYIFYHQEWNFTTDELGILATAMKGGVEKLLRQAEVIDITGKLRFYARPGHFSASFC